MESGVQKFVLFRWITLDQMSKNRCKLRVAEGAESTSPRIYMAPLYQYVLCSS